MPSPRLNPARQLPTPLPILGSAPGTWGQPRGACPLSPSSWSLTQGLAKGAPDAVSLKCLPGAWRLRRRRRRRRKVRRLCMPMARWLFGTSWSPLPGVLGTTPAQRHAGHSWQPARPQGRDRARPRCPQLPHASAPGLSPSPGWRGAGGQRCSVGFRCRTTLPRHAASPRSTLGNCEN